MERAKPLGHEWSLECPRPGCEQWAWKPGIGSVRDVCEETKLVCCLDVSPKRGTGLWLPQGRHVLVDQIDYLITARHPARHAQLSCKSVAHVHNKLISRGQAIESWKFCTAFTALECSFGDRFRNHRIHSLVEICITSHFDSLVTS